MTDEEEEIYLYWYEYGRTAASSLSITIANLLSKKKEERSDFIESAFFDGFRDNLTVDPIDE